LISLVLSGQGSKPGHLLRQPPGATISYAENLVIITVGDQQIFLTAYTGKEGKLTMLKSGTAYSISQFSLNAAGFSPATPGQDVISQ